MKDIYPRPVRPEDVSLIYAWIRNTPDNMFDPSILENANTKFYCAELGDPKYWHVPQIAFMPTQAVLMLESLAVNPKASELEVAKAIEVLMKLVSYKAEELKYRELWFVGRGKIVQYATRHNWEVVAEDKDRNVSVLRWKVSA
jgi:hypothetical protein